MLNKPSHAEIGKCSLATIKHVYILRAHITMIHLFPVGFLQGFRHVKYDAYLVCLLECLLAELAAQRAFVLISAYFVIVCLLLVHSACCLHYVWRCTDFLLRHTCVLYRQSQLLQFLRSLSCHVKRIFANLVMCRGYQFWHTKELRELFRFLKHLFYLIGEDFGALRFYTFNGLSGHEVCQLILQMGYRSSLAPYKLGIGQEPNQFIVQCECLLIAVAHWVKPELRLVGITQCYGSKYLSE